MKELVAGFLQGLISPVTDLMKQKQERKIARDAARARLSEAQLAASQATEERDLQITLRDSDWEHLAVPQTERSWKDEYVVISLIGIINAVIIGGILHGFGHKEFLTGVLVGVQALSVLIDLKMCMTAAVLSSLGLSVWKAFR